MTRYALLPLPSGRLLIEVERRRQVRQEGWTLEHDRTHGAPTLRLAAQCYHLEGGPGRTHEVPGTWPWDPKWWKPKGPLRNLVRAGALYQASLDAAQTPLDIAFAERGLEKCASAIDGLLDEVARL